MALVMMPKPRQVLKVGRFRACLDYDKTDRSTPVRLVIGLPLGETIPDARVPMTLYRLGPDCIAYLMVSLACEQVLSLGGCRLWWDRDASTYAGTPRLLIDGPRESFPVDRTEEVMS